MSILGKAVRVNGTWHDFVDEQDGTIVLGCGSEVTTVDVEEETKHVEYLSDIKSSRLEGDICQYCEGA